MQERRLEYVLAVAEELHFGRAAQRMYVSQPGLSQQVLALEKELGVALFDRSTRRVELTEAGVAFLPHARRALRELALARQEAQQAAAGQTGHLTVGFAGSATYQLLPRIIREYRHRHPRVDLTIANDLLTRSQIDGLTSGTLDVGFLRPPVRECGLATERVRTESLIAVLPTDHLLTSEPQIELATLADEPFLSYPSTEGSSSFAAMIAACDAAGFVPTVAQEATEAHTLVSLVAAGMGVALLPDSVSALGMAGVVYRPLSGDRSRLELWMAWRADEVSPTVAPFLEIARTFADVRSA